MDGKRQNNQATTADVTAAGARLIRLLCAEQSATAMLVASRAAHELGNPAAAVKNNLAFLGEVLPALRERLLRIAPVLGEELDEILQVVSETGEAADAMLARLVSLRGLDAGWSQVGLVDVAALVRELSGYVQAALGQRTSPVRFVFTLPEHLYVAGAEDALALVVVRALWLACSSHERMARDEPELWIWGASEGTHVRLRVEHRGLAGRTEGHSAGFTLQPERSSDTTSGKEWANFAQLVLARRKDSPSVGVVALRDLVERLGGELSCDSSVLSQEGPVRPCIEIVLPATSTEEAPG